MNNRVLSQQKADHRFASSRVMALSAFSAASLLVSVLCTPLASLSQPRLAVDKSATDLGVIYKGASKTTRLSLKNTGTDTLKVLKVETSCGCTTVRQPKRFLLPGEADFLEVSLNSATLHQGKATKRVTIETNDPDSAVVTVTVVATILAEFEPTDQTGVLWLGNLPFGVELVRSTSFKNVSGRAITVLKAGATSSVLKADVGRTKVAPGDSVKVIIRVTPVSEGYLNGEIFLETDSTNQPRIPLRVAFTGVKKE